MADDIEFELPDELPERPWSPMSGSATSRDIEELCFMASRA